MVQVTLKTEPKQIIALRSNLYTGKKERAALIEAIFAKGSLNSLLNIATLLNSKEAQSIFAAYEHKMHFNTAITLLADFPATKGFIPVREWLLTALLKAPLKYLVDKRHKILVPDRHNTVWWPLRSLKRRDELDRFFKKVVKGENGKYVPILAHNPLFFRALTEEQKKIVNAAK